MSWSILDSCCLKCRSLSLCFRRGSAKIIAGNVGHEVLSFLLPSPFLVLHSCPGPFSKFHLLGAFSLLAEAPVTSGERCSQPQPVTVLSVCVALS